MQSACAIFVEICLCPLCIHVIKLIKMGNVSSIPKESSLGSILDMLRPEGPWVTRKNTISQLAVLSQGEEHSDTIGLEPPLDLRQPIIIFPIGAPGNFGSGSFSSSLGALPGKENYNILENCPRLSGTWSHLWDILAIWFFGIFLLFAFFFFFYDFLLVWFANTGFWY